MSIPGVDFAALTHASPEVRGPAVASLRAAAASFGAFGIEGHGLSPELVSKAFQLGRAYFDLPLSAKLAARTEGPAPDGYHPNPQTGDLREKLMRTYGRMGPLAARPWPSEPPELASVMDALVGAFEPVSMGLVRGLCSVLEASPHALDFAFENRGARATWIHRYPAVPERDGRRGQGTSAHTDFAPIGLLLQDEVGGLELRDRAGAWHRVDPNRWPLVAIVGDLFERWSNGGLKPSVHRVSSDPARARFSILCSVLPDWDAVVEPLPACVGSATPARYPPVTFGAAMRRWVEELETGAAGSVPDQRAQVSKAG